MIHISNHVWLETDFKFVFPSLSQAISSSVHRQSRRESFSVYASRLIISLGVRMKNHHKEQNVNNVGKILGGETVNTLDTCIEK